MGIQPFHATLRPAQNAPRDRTFGERQRAVLLRVSFWQDDETDSILPLSLISDSVILPLSLISDFTIISDQCQFKYFFFAFSWKQVLPLWLLIELQACKILISQFLTFFVFDLSLSVHPTVCLSVSSLLAVVISDRPGSLSSVTSASSASSPELGQISPRHESPAASSARRVRPSSLAGNGDAMHGMKV